MVFCVWGMGRCNGFWDLGSMGGFLIRLELGRMSLADRFEFFFSFSFFLSKSDSSEGGFICRGC